MNFLTLTALFFLTSCLAADTPDNSSRVSPSDKPNNIGKLHSFLCLFGKHKESHDDVISFGYALENQNGIVRYDLASAKIFVSREKLTEIITAEYDSSTGKRNPFHKFCKVDALLTKLESSNSEMSHVQFRRLISRCAYNRNALVSVDIAILNWLAGAIYGNININVKPSWLRSFCFLYLQPNLPAKCQTNILHLLSHVRRKIKTKTLSKEQLSKYARVFLKLLNVFESPQVMKLLKNTENPQIYGDILEVIDTILALTTRNI